MKTLIRDWNIYKRHHLSKLNEDIVKKLEFSYGIQKLKNKL
jgi:hypothetical protein